MAKWVRDFTADGRGFDQANPASNKFFSEGSYSVNGWFVYTKQNPGSGTFTSGDLIRDFSIKGSARDGIKDELFFDRISRVKESTNTPIIGDAVGARRSPSRACPARRR